MAQYRYQASEVAITSGGTAKVRPLSTEEIGLQRMADEKAQQLKEELEALKNSPPASSPGAAVAAVMAKSRSAAISGLSIESRSSQSSSIAQRVDAMDSGASIKKQQISAPSSSELKISAVQQKVVPVPQQPKPTPAVPVASRGETIKEELLNGAPAVKMIRKLDKDELEIAGKALQLTVMHRGGGPFGAGRLVADEAQQLSAALHAAYDLLKRDAGSAAVVQTELPASKSLEEVLQLPALKGVAAAAAVKSDALPRKVNDRVSPVVQVERSSQTASSTTTSTKASTARPQQVRPAAAIPSPDRSEQSSSSAESKPIALGLDSFLQNPRSLDLTVSSSRPIPLSSGEAVVSVIMDDGSHFILFHHHRN